MSRLVLLILLSQTAAPAPQPQPPAASPSPEQPAAYLDLAAELARLGEYDQCAVEALRHAYLHPEGRSVGFERAAYCLDLAHRYPDARRLVLELGTVGALAPRARFRLCYTEVFLKDDRSMADCRADGPDRYDRLAAYAPVMQSIAADDWSEARRRLDAQRAPGPADWALQDNDFIVRHEQLPHRSPWVAALLSTLLPGAGRAYLGRWGDGVFSLLLVGVPAGFAAHDFYVHGFGNGAGWVLTALAGVFYAGDVYGSAVGAVVWNRRVADSLCQEIDSAYAGRADP